MSSTAAHPCPTCKKPVETKTAAWPFCSDRCRLVDLGNWLGGKYRVPGEPSGTPPDDDSQPE